MARRKVLALILTGAMAVSLTACGGKDAKDNGGATDTKVTTEAESKAGDEADTETESEAVSEAETEVVSEAVSEAETEAASEAETEAASEAETEAVSEAETEAASEAETEAASEAETEAASEAETEVASEAETEAASEAETEAEAATKVASKAGTEAVSEAETEAASEAAGEEETEVASEAETEAVSEAASEAETEAVSEAASEAETEAASEEVSEGRTVDKDIFVLGDDEWFGTDLYQQDSWTTGQSLIADPLFTLNPDGGDLLDGICTDLTTSEDGLTMTMTVPEGKYYATGEQVEPEDVVASIEWGQEVSPYADGYSNIESMEVDGRQVIFHLTEFRSDLLYYLGECFMGVIDKDQLDSMSKEELMWSAVPYGMYQVESFEPGSGATLVANEGYKSDNPLIENKGPAKIKNIEVKFNVEEFTAIEELKAGDIDFINGITMDGKAQLESEEGIKIPEKTYPNIEYFEMNTDEGSVFEDLAVRQAVALSLDREKLCDLTDGATKPAYSMIYDSVKNFSQEAKDDFTENYANDPERAKKILEEAGYTDSDGDGYVDKDGTNVEFTYYTRSTGTSVTIAQGMQEQLKEVGILMNIESIDWNYIYENIANDEYDAGIEVLEWAEPILVLQCCYYDSDAPGNTDEYYEAVNDAASTVDSDERTEKIGEIQKEMFKNWNIIPFYSDVTYIAYNDYVKGITIQADGALYWNDLSF